MKTFRDQMLEVYALFCNQQLFSGRTVLFVKLPA